MKTVALRDLETDQIRLDLRSFLAVHSYVLEDDQI